MTDETISTTELCELLERNGYPAAAEKIAAGEDRCVVTRYIAGRSPVYDDAEGLWLQEYIERLARQEDKREAEAFFQGVCLCPDDCNCHHSWRTNYCGCKAHNA